MSGYTIGYELHGPDGAAVDLGNVLRCGYTGNSFTVGQAQYGALVEEKGITVLPWDDLLLWRGGAIQTIKEAERLLGDALASHPSGRLAVAGAGGPALAKLANAREVLSVTATRFEIGVPREFAGETWTAQVVLRAPP
jgi:hypothetical protein